MNTAMPLFESRIDPDQLKKIEIKLKGGRQSDIYVGHDCLFSLPALVKTHVTGSKCAVISNAEIKKLYGESLISGLKNNGFETFSIDVPQGEKFKSLDMTTRILDSFISNKLERIDTVIALGGGVIGDLSGFVASIYLRGINFIQVPTSLLAQVDAAIGGKTGVNHERGKNLIGTFYQPLFTFCDTATIQTLPQKEIRCGLAEIIKYGIIRNKALFWYLERHADIIKQDKYTDDSKIWQYLVTKSAQNKAVVVSQDEREGGYREILNFGHTIGHGIENAFNYKTYSHGEAVALGMKAEAIIAYKKKLIPKKTVTRICNLMENLGFNLTLQSVNKDKILAAMKLDKKVRNGKLRFVLPDQIGSTVTVSDISEKILHDSIEEIMEN